MKRRTLKKISLFLALSGALLPPAFAEPGFSTADKVVRADSKEGLRRLERAEFKADFIPLANHFEGQINDFFCGAASAVIVLNTLRGKDGKPYTQDTFFDQDTDRIKTRAKVIGEAGRSDPHPDEGLQLAELQKMLQVHLVKAEIRVANERFSETTIRDEFIKNLGEDGNFILVNYDRAVLGQEGHGHISPVGAYDKKTDSVLVLDVNSRERRWVWVKLPALVQAMRTFDTVQNRGYLVVSG